MPMYVGEWWQRMVATDGGNGWWQRMVATDGGNGWWQRMVANLSYLVRGPVELARSHSTSL